MKWIVLGEEKGMIKMVSKSGTDGLIPKGAYLTIEKGDNKFILRVDDSKQDEPYSPSPLVIDMNLKPMLQDQKCQNIIYARRVKDLVERVDGLIDFIPALSVARRSNQEEIELALGGGSKNNGPTVMLSTIHSSRSQLLTDENKNPIIINIPENFFYHQIMICGRTGSGKTVASKYLAEYFTEVLQGAVIAINVKDDDFLHMDKPSRTSKKDVLKEWEVLGLSPVGLENYTIYFPANIDFKTVRNINEKKCKKITLDVKSIDPEALSGLIRGISDIGAQSLPSIFRYWQQLESKKNANYRFVDFVNYFSLAQNDGKSFRTMNIRYEESSEITLHSGTYNNILRNLNNAVDFFDNPNSETIGADDILQNGKMSVINVAGQKGVEFGAILLRHLLHQIVETKSQRRSDVPVLIIIDEVHQFYNNESSKETLGDIDTICRTGRSQEIGVIFSSQNPSDIPRGLSSVINTKIIFKSDSSTVKAQGINFNTEELENLRTGYAAVSIHNLSQVKSVKFPMALSGVFEKEEK
jgi:DNA helicase HerA-like ATPase